MDQIVFKLECSMDANDILDLQELLKGTEFEYISDLFILQMNDQLKTAE